MKKFFLILFILYPANILAITANSYIVMEQNTNTVLLGNNYNQESLIASITKILTAIIVIENCDIKEVIEVDSEVLKAYGSAIYIEVGEKISVEDLLYGLMLRSGNDAALILANHISETEENFSKLMNEYVKKLNLKNTNFKNASGLDELTENISTAYDMAVIMNYAMKNEIFKKITSTNTYTAKTNYKNYTWDNKNRLLGNNEYTTGGKTGYTVKANRTLVTTATNNFIDITVVTLNDANDFENHASLYNEIFKNYESIQVINKDITSFKDEQYYYFFKNDYNITVLKNKKNEVEIKYEIFEKKIGNIAGIAKIFLDNTIIHEEKIFSVLIEEKEKEKIFFKIMEWFKNW